MVNCTQVNHSHCTQKNLGFFLDLPSIPAQDRAGKMDIVAGKMDIGEYNVFTIFTQHNTYLLIYISLITL